MTDNKANKIIEILEREIYKTMDLMNECNEAMTKFSFDPEVRESFKESYSEYVKKLIVLDQIRFSIREEIGL